MPPPLLAGLKEERLRADCELKPGRCGLQRKRRRGRGWEACESAGGGDERKTHLSQGAPEPLKLCNLLLLLLNLGSGEGLPRCGEWGRRSAAPARAGHRGLASWLRIGDVMGGIGRRERTCELAQDPLQLLDLFSEGLELRLLVLVLRDKLRSQEYVLAGLQLAQAATEALTSPQNRPVRLIQDTPS